MAFWGSHRESCYLRGYAVHNQSCTCARTCLRSGAVRVALSLERRWGRRVTARRSSRRSLRGRGSIEGAERVMLVHEFLEIHPGDNQVPSRKEERCVAHYCVDIWHMARWTWTLDRLTVWRSTGHSQQLGTGVQSLGWGGNFITKM